MSVTMEATDGKVTRNGTRKEKKIDQVLYNIGTITTHLKRFVKNEVIHQAWANFLGNVSLGVVITTYFAHILANVVCRNCLKVDPENIEVLRNLSVLYIHTRSVLSRYIYIGLYLANFSFSLFLSSKSIHFVLYRINAKIVRRSSVLSDFIPSCSV